MSWWMIVILALIYSACAVIFDVAIRVMWEHTERQTWQEILAMALWPLSLTGGILLMVLEAVFLQLPAKISEKILKRKKK